MAKGTVKWFNSQKGYGFIQPQAGGKDVFVHISAVERAGLTGLNEGQVVEYEEVANKGKTWAEFLRFNANDRGAQINHAQSRHDHHHSPRIKFSTHPCPLVSVPQINKCCWTLARPNLTPVGFPEVDAFSAK